MNWIVASARRHHRRSDRHREIHALVHAGIAEDGMEAHAEAGRDARAVHRRLHQHALGGLALGVEIIRRLVGIGLIAVERDVLAATACRRA